MSVITTHTTVTVNGQGVQPIHDMEDRWINEWSVVHTTVNHFSPPAPEL